MSAVVEVSKEKAVAIAKEFMIEQGLDKSYVISKPYNVKNEVWYRSVNGKLVQSNPGKNAAYLEERMWQVIFTPKTKGFQIGNHLAVLINQGTGKVENHWYYKW